MAWWLIACNWNPLSKTWQKLHDTYDPKIHIGCMFMAISARMNTCQTGVTQNFWTSCWFIWLRPIVPKASKTVCDFNPKMEFFVCQDFWVVVSNIFYFHPYLGKMNPFWRAYFSKGLKPPTRFDFVRNIWGFGCCQLHWFGCHCSWCLTSIYVRRSSERGMISLKSYPIGSMYGIFTYIWLISMVNVGKYTIHGSLGYWDIPISTKTPEEISEHPKQKHRTSLGEQFLDMLHGTVKAFGWIVMTCG